MKKFEIGKTYSTRAAGDHNLFYTYTVTARTARTVTIKDDTGRETKHRIRTRPDRIEEAETIYPEGRYSLAPVLRAI